MENSISIPVLPAELVTEILSRLPVKFLLKFKCASKSWLALISSPEFAKTHLRLNANNNEYTRRHNKVMMFERIVPSFRDCSVSSLYNNSCIEAKDLYYHRQVPDCAYTVGSVNGLICLVSPEKELILWNPSIRKYKKLPTPKIKTTLGYCLYSFGYDEFRDDYKVVVLWNDNLSPQIEVQKYSLKRDSWRWVDDCPSMVPLTQSGNFVNGKIYWITSIHPNTRSIISIDLADGKWGEMELPCYWKGGRGLLLSFGVLAVLGSDLLIWCGFVETDMVDVWLRKEYGVKESWIKMFTLNILRDLSVYGYLEPIHLYMASGSEILVVLGSKFMIYNLKGDQLRSSKVINSYNWDEEEIYIESLVCPFSTVGTEDATKMVMKSLGCETMK
ncbi:F-box/kelch-repeat protein At3g23880-like [Solanum lycopersicum]|uniref:F-box domain-containing protein n=1 Tax=Solanum lycopersicum TaxID=4081 RepID=A0A3Q7I552_SOLLC|nr:F-box/kelch-repeat protein At3g23880-like [Solanum lycopersicum]